jgi:ribokinase
LSLLKQASGSLSVDPGASLSKYSLAELRPYLKKVRVFLPNESEAERITGHSYKRAAQELLDAGIEVVVIKLGRGGSYLLTKDESFKTRSLDYKALDTTGAGDAFDSAFITAWFKGKSLREACEWGIISSNICITRLGAQNSATMKELMDVKEKEFSCC